MTARQLQSVAFVIVAVALPWAWAALIAPFLYVIWFAEGRVL